MENNGFSVHDMVDDLDNENEDFDAAELFKKNPVSGNIKKDAGEDVIIQPMGSDGPVLPPNPLKSKATPPTAPPPVVDDSPLPPVSPPSPLRNKPPEKKIWTPDVEGMEEFNRGPVTYDADEITTAGSGALSNIADDVALDESKEAMDDMTRKHANIEESKKRLGLIKLNIPTFYHAKIMDSAGDTNSQRAKEGLDQLLKEIIELHPEAVIEWAPGRGPESVASPSTSITQPQFTEVPPGVEESDTSTEFNVMNNIPVDDDKMSIIIDKRDIPEVAFSAEDIEKIKKVRQIELKIVEDVEVKYTNIEDVDDVNNVDVVLAQYTRKTNDVTGTLPASNYRATFSGLTYAEILDLSYSTEVNTLDTERKKWSIVFNHIKNPSIGPFIAHEDRDPKTDAIIKRYSAFDDFLKKTSYLDLDYMLWRVLCASCMDSEVLSIDCKMRPKDINGVLSDKLCGHVYDWVYSPAELLQMDKMNPDVLENLKKTAEVKTKEAIEKQYKMSMLNIGNSVVLPNSGFTVMFGHVSAYDYLNEIYGEVKALEDAENPMLSTALSYLTLPVIKSFLLPKVSGAGHIRVKGVQGIVKVIEQLNEVDWQTVGELVRIMTEPYQLSFVLKGIVCPQCKIRSDINIQDIANLVFTMSQSLANVNVVLKRT